MHARAYIDTHAQTRTQRDTEVERHTYTQTHMWKHTCTHRDSREHITQAPTHNILIPKTVLLCAMFSYVFYAY